jgi:3-phosphoshikimate 1-carboxyvinyltransferase
VPSDKSIVHRAILFPALAEGKSVITVSFPGRDNLQSFRVMRELAVRIEVELPPSVRKMAAAEGIVTEASSSGSTAKFTIYGTGAGGLRKPARDLYCGNSGTTARLMTGVLAGCDFSATLTGDESLSRRPFARVVEPLTQMGAKFSGDKLPLAVTGGKLRGIEYHSPRASAQVKSAILVAGLFTGDAVSVIQPMQSRDHTERMFTAMGVQVSGGKTAGGGWRVELPAGKRQLSPLAINIGGDFSAASFFLVAAALAPGSEVVIEQVNCNPSRLGLLHLLKRMGAAVGIEEERDSGGEPLASLRVRSSSLSGITVSPEEVVLAIDEIPILAVAAACAAGTTEIRSAAELRVKESDRLKMTALLLQDFGVDVTELEDGLVIRGNPDLAGSGKRPENRPAVWDHTGDHRISMAGAVLEYLSAGGFTLFERESVETSFPTFVDCFLELTAHSGGQIAGGMQ